MPAICQAIRSSVSSSRWRSLRRSALGVAAACVLGSNAALAQDDAATDWNDTFYMLGALMADQLIELAPDADELDAMIDGLRDRFGDETPRVDMAEQGDRIPQLIAERRQVALGSVRADGAAYLQAFVDDGGTLTESGLAYRITSPGEGEPPLPTDLIEVHYEGRLIDGTVFDSSYQRGEPARFPLNNVIPGWVEGLQLIAPGGEITLVIPSELAYGDEGSPPVIPGGATLVFDVELIAIDE